MSDIGIKSYLGGKPQFGGKQKTQGLGKLGSLGFSKGERRLFYSLIADMGKGGQVFFKESEMFTIYVKFFSLDWY